MSDAYAIVLAAGQGKRMKSDLPKVLHLVGGRPMVLFPLLNVQKIAKKSFLIVPKKYNLIQDMVSSYGIENVNYVVQQPPRGTGDAVRCAIDAGKLKSKKGCVIVLNGDMPLISKQTIQSLLKKHRRQKNTVTFLTTKMDQPLAYGRVLRNSRGEVIGTVEEKDASPQQKKINEVNVGVYVFDLQFLSSEIYKLSSKNKQNEYYLPDLIQLAKKKQLPVSTYELSDVEEAYGANFRQELSLVNATYYKKRRDQLTKEGVFLFGHDIFVDADSFVKARTTLEAPCYIKGSTTIAKDVFIESGSVLKSSQVQAGTHIKAHCYLDQADVGKNCQVGPFAHLRPETKLKDNVKVGNFVETKKTTIGQNSKANHLAYLGDAQIGQSVNIGAGTITCNYDGVKKWPTYIEDGVFIGSDSQLVAPVRLEKGSFVGAGTTVTKNVKANSLVISRAPQREILDWAKRRFQK